LRWSSTHFESTSEFRTRDGRLLQVQIPTSCYNHHLFSFAAGLMRNVTGYETDHRYATVEYLIWLMIQLNSSWVPYVMLLILKCTTIWLEISVGIWGTCNVGADPMQCPSYRAILAITKWFPQVGINYGKWGFPFWCFNARTLCKHDEKGHCHIWSIEEGRFLASVLCIFSWVCAKIGIPIIIPCFGGTQACVPFFHSFKEALMIFDGTAYSTMMTRYVHCVSEGTHVSNMSLRRCITWKSIEEQVSNNYLYNYWKS
jgi:hypothetical protein